MHKVSKALLLFSFSFLLIFNSCTNLFENSVDNQNQNTQTADSAGQTPAAAAISKFTFGGSLRVEGALPSALQQALTNPNEAEIDPLVTDDSRSARPSISTGTNYEYYVRAYTDDGAQPQETNPQLVDGVYSYSLELELEHTWKFEAGFRRKAIGTQGEAGYQPARQLLIDYDSKRNTPYSLDLHTASGSLGEQNHTFILCPSQSENGKGSINLSMNVSGADSVVITAVDDDGIAQTWNGNGTVSLISPTVAEPGIWHIRSVGLNPYNLENTAHQVKSGSYDLTLKFYRNYTISGVDVPIQVYTSYQTISVFDNMITDTWVNENAAVSGVTPVINSSGVFEVNDTIISQSVERTIYVGVPESVHAQIPNLTANDNYTGAPYAPLATLTGAFNKIQALGAGGEYNIYLSGSHTGNFIIPSDINNTKASSIILKTYDGNSNTAVLNGAGGSTLTVDSAVPVTIQNLKITGGSGTSEGSTIKGGGIYIKAGTVTLANGVKVVGNKAYSSDSSIQSMGGGIYVETSATLYMKGTALVGDLSTTPISWYLNSAPSDLTDANYAREGGGIYSKGNLYLGCNSSGETASGYALNSEYGIRHNNSNYGGGINIAGGVFKFASGKIAFNKSGSNGAGIYAGASSEEIKLGAVSIESNKANSDGGGIFIASGCTVTMDGNASIAKNQASSGGGVNILGTFNMSAGTIGGDSFDYKNFATNSGGVDVDVGSANPHPAGVFNMSGGKISYNESGNNGGGVGISTIDTTKATFNMSGGSIIHNKTPNYGGAVCQAGIFNISGSASIPYVVFADEENPNRMCKNDVYVFYDDGTISVNGTFDSTSPEKIATITPNTWSRGKTVISKGSSLSELTTDILNKFDTTDEDYVVNRKGTGSSALGVLQAPIYVAALDTSRSVCPNAPDTDVTKQSGSKRNPYSSMSSAISQLTDSTVDYEIRVDGIIKGSAAQANFSGDSLAANSLILLGAKNGSSDTSENALYLKPNFSTEYLLSGSVITVNKTGFEVTIENLTISYGSAGSSGTGGGITLTNGTVKLGNGAHVTKNYSSNYGGGINISSGGTLFMYGTSMVGDDTESEAGGNVLNVTSDFVKNNQCANFANYGGGGIYNEGNLYIGYSGFENGVLKESAMADGYGVRRNASSGYRSGGVCYNGYGGGIYSSSSATLKIASGTISYNSSRFGGGLYAGGANNEINGSAKFSNNKAEEGGAISTMNNTTLALNGNVLIENNVVKKPFPDCNETTFRGGAICIGSTNSVLELKDKVYIPCTGVKQNDIFLPSGQAIKITGAISLPTSITDNTKKNAYITPSVWTRGTQVLDGTNATLITNNASRFAVTDSEWKVVSNADVAGRLDTDYIYVSGSSSVTVGSGASAVVYGAGTTASNGALGTKAKPYSTIAEAAAQCWKGPNDTASNTGRQINIVGTIPGGQSIPSTITTTNNASMITLKGINSNATLNGGFSNEEGHQGTTLSIGSEVPVKIETLKITGGYNENGGGMNISAGTVILGDGAIVQGNTATSFGGGVYVDSGASLFMYKSALIGESSSPAPDSEAAASNCALKNGGGIYSKGKVYLGYTGYNGTNPVEGTGSNKLTGGVIHNYAKFGVNGNGGGVCISSGTFKMASGNISYNAATGYGGAVWGAGTISGGTIEGNEAVKDGGAVYFTGTLTISSGTFIKNRSTGGNGGAICSGGGASTIEMTGGIIGDATDTSLRNTASLAGGAIYSAGILKMKGAASIPNCGGETLNDVFLASGKSITINGSFDNGNNDVATITPYAWTRSTVVLQASSPVTTINSTIAGKFAVSDPDWEVLSHASKGKLNGVMYVSEGKIVNSDAYSVGYDSTSYDGTKKKPFKTLQYAANKCWDSEITKTVDFKIIVNGTLNGTQTISETESTNVAWAKSITVEGMADYSAYTGNSKINANVSSPQDNGSALIIDTSVPVTLNKLDITGGKTNDGGGGIRIDNANSNVTITNSNIYGNYTAGTTSSKGGGGILLKNGILCLSENTIVHSNRSKAYGGGICNYNGKVYICGGNKGAIIGYKKDINSRAQSNSEKANRAGIDNTGSANTFGNGGGLYSASIANTCVYIGYKPPATTGGAPVADSGFNGGFYYNYAVTSGGGMYYDSGYSGQEFKMSKGTIQFNVAGNGGGGGIYAGGTTTIENCVISENSADNSSGGGIYSNGSLTINRGTIGRTEGVNDAAQFGPNRYSNSAKYGGGISMSGGTIGSNVTISYNYASETGGGISAGNTSDQTISGIIQFNGAGASGGGISVGGNGSAHSLNLSANMKTNKAYGSEGGGAIYMSGSGRKVVLKTGFNIEGLSSSVTKGTDDILVYYSYNYENLHQISPTRYTYIYIDTALPVGSGNFIGIGLKTYSGDPYRAPDGVLIFDGSTTSCPTWFKTTDSGHRVLSTGVVQ